LILTATSLGTRNKILLTYLAAVHAFKACLQILLDTINCKILTHASIMDGSVKYKTLKKLKLQVLCGNLIDHIEDLEEELKEAKVKKAKVELESEEDVFFVGNGTGATTSGGSWS
jgi:hypothetical protein